MNPLKLYCLLSMREVLLFGKYLIILNPMLLKSNSNLLYLTMLIMINP